MARVPAVHPGGQPAGAGGDRTIRGGFGAFASSGTAVPGERDEGRNGPAPGSRAPAVHALHGRGRLDHRSWCAPSGSRRGQEPNRVATSRAGAADVRPQRIGPRGRWNGDSALESTPCPGWVTTLIISPVNLVVLWLRCARIRRPQGPKGAR